MRPLRANAHALSAKINVREEDDQLSKYADLKLQIERLQQQAEEARRAELETAIAAIRRSIDEYGLTARDLGFAEIPRRGRPPNRTPSLPRYRDPKTGATWTGKGRAPKWIEGKNRERFLIHPG